MASWEEMKSVLADYESQWSELEPLMIGKGLARDASYIGRLMRTMRSSMNHAEAAEARNSRTICMFWLMKTMATCSKIDSRIKKIERTT